MCIWLYILNIDNLINFIGIFLNVVIVLDNFVGGLKKKINNRLVVIFRIEWIVLVIIFFEFLVFIKFLIVLILLYFFYIWIGVDIVICFKFCWILDIIGNKRLLNMNLFKI